MKKLVLVVAMFMFVCGGSFLVKAQNAASVSLEQGAVKDTVVTDTVAKPAQDEPVKE